MESLWNFYDPIVVDSEVGGFYNQIRDDGSIYDYDTKHVVGTARFIANYAMSYILFGQEKHKEMAEHGIAFLMNNHWD